MRKGTDQFSPGLIHWKDMRFDFQARMCGSVLCLPARAEQTIWERLECHVVSFEPVVSFLTAFEQPKAHPCTQTRSIRSCGSPIVSDALWRMLMGKKAKVWITRVGKGDFLLTVRKRVNRVANNYGIDDIDMLNTLKGAARR
jgi:hypothetical protein